MDFRSKKRWIAYENVRMWKRGVNLTGWFTIADPAKGVENELSLHKEENPLQLSMDIRSSPTEQDMALISFYKPPNVEWGRPLN
ncbi:unnamed protein product [Boreogadus saida]